MRPAVTTKLTLVGGAAAWALPAPAAHFPSLAGAFSIPTRRDDVDGVAITFDDGPHAVATPQVAEILAARGAHATFFVLGHQLRSTGTLAADLVAAGHTLALHGDEHPNALRLTPAQLVDDVRRGQDAVQDATGLVPTLYRPPFGILSYPGLRAVRGAGFEVLLWSRWGRDWTRRATAQSVVARVLGPGPLSAGDVVLLHDADDHGAAGCWKSTVGALPALLDAVQDAGLRAVGL